MNDAQLAALWRRQFEVYDDLVYGYLLGESERREARWHRSLRGKCHRWTTPVRQPWPRFVVWPFWRALPRLAERLTEREARRQAPPSAGVTFADLSGARHGLSVPRFYPSGGRMLSEEHFRSSDLLSESYAGKLEAELRRVRNEIDSEPA